MLTIQRLVGHIMKLRDYQIAAEQSVFDYFESNSGNPIVAMPTGTGKSVVIASLLMRMVKLYPRTKVIMVTHVKELIEQNYEKLMQLWPTAPAGVYSAGLGRKDFSNQIVFAGIGSVAKKAELFSKVDIVMIDEAHLVNPKEEGMYRSFLAELKKANQFVKVIGFTATPWRLGHGHITDDGIFTDVCFDITDMSSFNRLIQEGYLCPLIPKRTKFQFNTENLSKQGGDFKASEMQEAFNKHTITEMAICEVLQHGADREHWLIFASGVEHADSVAEMLNAAGIRTVSIHGKMTDSARDEAISKWKSGYYRCAVNNNILTTGIDFPGIDLIAMFRATCSVVLWIQMLGRGTRPLYSSGHDLSSAEGRVEAIRTSDKRDCLVLDFSGNTERLGAINDPLVPKKKGDKTGGKAPVRLCPNCETYNHASVRSCQYCGYVFPVAPKFKPTSGTGELIKEDVPIVETFKVDHLTYSLHNKDGKAAMIKVSYYCGFRMFNQYVCFGHSGFARKKAVEWWRERSFMEVPSNSESAIEILDKVKAPSHLRVWINRRYPEILGCCFDGTAFGKLEEAVSAPEADVIISKSELGIDDDIPF
jgi:DNA repair protein RadD